MKKQKKDKTSESAEQIKKRIIHVKSTLSGQQQGIKQYLLKGGQFDAAGEKFERTRK